MRYLWKSSVLPETLHCAVLLCDADDYAILVIHWLFIVIACMDTDKHRGSVGDPVRMFLGLPDPDNLVKVTDPDPAPDPSLFA
jgi:hypothetical protein